jgi:Lon protease-like protein
MKQSLPARPSLEHLKTQAKDLLSAAKTGDSAALARFAASLARVPSNLALHDAQSVIAREHGFESWRALREKVLADPGEENLRALYSLHFTVTIPRDVIAAALGMGFPLREELELPPELPLLPLRNALLAPSAVAPLDIGRPSTIAAIEAAQKADGLLAVFAQRDPAVEEPHETDFHPIGCVARIVKATAKPEAGMWVVVHALAWVELDSLADGRAAIAPFAVEEDASPRVDQLRHAVNDAVAKLPDPESIRARIERMTPLELADAAVVNAPCSVQAKADYASERRLSARIDRALALLTG